MKIKTRNLSYDEVMTLPRPVHRAPLKPNLFFRTLMRTLGSADLKATDFSWTTERMEEMGDGPYLVLMNHSSFIDLEIAARILYPKPFNIVCTSDGFVGKEWLMRHLGCIPTNKFTTDITLMADMAYALHKRGCSVLLYPEASYSFDGTATPLPRGLGVILKRLRVPVICIKTEGAFARDPLYNCLQKREVKVRATVTGLFTPEELKQSSNTAIERRLDEIFSFDNFAWQRDNEIEIDEPFRADGLERILYKCPACEREDTMHGNGTGLRCSGCGKSWEMDVFGQLHATEGTTRFSHIPDWYAWERSCVREEIENGSYRLDIKVDIAMMVDYQGIYMVGSGRLVHDNSGFHLTGCQGKLDYIRPANQCYSLYADYYWYELGDIICIGDRDTQYYCFPENHVPVAKARLATEELYKRLQKRVVSEP